MDKNEKKIFESNLKFDDPFGAVIELLNSASKAEFKV